MFSMVAIIVTFVIAMKISKAFASRVRDIPKKVQESGKCFFTTREQGSLEVTEPTEKD
jgi:hypothetical protein